MRLHFIGGAITTSLNHVKPDTILKNFWHDNDRFADLFNATLFHGRSVLNPDTLIDIDTDVSSTITAKGHSESVQHIFDIAKKSANGVDYILLGLENQEHVHYAMPLRHMLGDALTYYKEYKEIAARNRQDKSYASPDEFLSGFQKNDKLHPVITLCVYYGKALWDGPLCLTDMMDIPEDLKELVSDYKINLMQVVQTENCFFQHPDVQGFFKLCQLFYKQDIESIISFYEEQSFSTELGLAVGAVTGSKKLIQYASQAEQKGDTTMKQWQCITDWENKCERKGELKCVPLMLQTYKNFNISKETALEKITQDFSLSTEEAASFMEKCW